MAKSKRAPAVRRRRAKRPAPRAQRRSNPRQQAIRLDLTRRALELPDEERVKLFAALRGHLQSEAPKETPRRGRPDGGGIQPEEDRPPRAYVTKAHRNGRVTVARIEAGTRRTPFHPRANRAGLGRGGGHHRLRHVTNQGTYWGIGSAPSGSMSPRYANIWRAVTSASCWAAGANAVPPRATRTACLIWLA